MSSDGAIVAIGSPSNGAGQVRVYALTGGAWVQRGADIDGEASNDRSGFSVSLSEDGTYLAIGAPGNNSNRGHVRVFGFNSGTNSWDQVGGDIDGDAVGDQSGSAVSLSPDGTAVAVGAPGRSVNGFAAGQTRVYALDSGNWTLQGGDIDGEAANDNSGTSLSLVSSSGSLIIAIGAPGNSGNGAASGQVRVYALAGGTWTQQGADIDGEAASDASGSAVSLAADGSMVAIGAPGNGGNGPASGQVRIYALQSGSWEQQGGDIDGEVENDASGSSVSLSADGTKVAIGAPGNDGNGSESGQVRVFTFDAVNWQQFGADIDGSAAADGIGESVFLSSDGEIVAVGAPGNDGNGGESGHARIINIKGY